MKEIYTTEEEFLENYNPGDYERPSVTVDAAVFSVIDSKLKILLIKRKNHPWKDQWALPGGFVEIDESLDDAVVRELKEETGASDIKYFRQLYTFGKPDRDPRTRVIDVAYLALTPYESLNIQANDDASEAIWFEVSKKSSFSSNNRRNSVLLIENKELNIKMEYFITDKVMNGFIKRDSNLKPSSNTSLAADHIKIVNLAMDELQNNVAETGLLFNLLPQEFTLKEAQDIYQKITGSKVDTPNFRRKIKAMLIETSNTVKTYNKFSKLYRFNPLFKYLKGDLS